MNLVRPLSILILSLGLLGACTDLQDSPKQTIGTLLGAGAGALAG